MPLVFTGVRVLNHLHEAKKILKGIYPGIVKEIETFEGKIKKAYKKARREAQFAIHTAAGLTTEELKALDWENLTDAMISRKLGITRERVRQIRKGLGIPKSKNHNLDESDVKRTASILAILRKELGEEKLATLTVDQITEELSSGGISITKGTVVWGGEPYRFANYRCHYGKSDAKFRFKIAPEHLGIYREAYRREKEAATAYFRSKQLPDLEIAQILHSANEKVIEKGLSELL